MGERRRLSWHLPLRPLLPLSLRLMPMPTTATAMVLATTVLATTVWATGPTATTARGRLRLRLIPTTTVDTDTEATVCGLTDTVLGATTVATTESVRLRLSPTTVSTLPTTLLPLLLATHTMPSLPLLSEEPTLVPDATSPTPPEPSMLPRGRLRPTPTTTEDTMATVSDTGATEDTVSDTAVDTTGVRFCLDVLDLDATTLCPWIGSRRI